VPVGSDVRARLIAVDNSPHMIEALWPAEAGTAAEAVCGDWRAIPLPDGSADIALADGSLNLLKYPEGYDEVLGELRRVLRPRSRIAIRCFVQPAQRESCSEIWENANAGRVGNFHILKWRLLMALRRNGTPAVRIGDAYEEVHRASNGELPALARRFGWSVEEVQTIAVYRGSDTCYTFPTRDQFQACFAQAGFALVNCVTPAYELGERCPTFVLDRMC
jgi:ubiquinone/menaquinone biosynthesis C-methylase UbiE